MRFCSFCALECQSRHCSWTAAAGAALNYCSISKSSTLPPSHHPKTTAMLSAEKPLDVVVRFSSSNPDVIVNIPQPSSVSIASLKLLIRGQLPATVSQARLRLIHSGKVLIDAVALSRSVNVTQPPPARDAENKSAKAKGKQPVRDAARVYIHCSIGDTLTGEELRLERQAAETADSAILSKTTITSTTPGYGPQEHETTTAAAPRGFDRLLSAGFTAAEVAALRAQFLAIQAHTHTPDTMPTGQELIALEETWLDNGSNPATNATQDIGTFGSEDAGGLEDLLYGNLIGFFWPIGGMFWLMKEEGVWSRRRQICVLSGFLVNLTLGITRIAS